MDKKTVITSKKIKPKFTKYFKSEMDSMNIDLENELGSKITLEFIYDLKKPSSAVAKKYLNFKKKYSTEITTILVSFCRNVLKEDLDDIVFPDEIEKKKLEPNSKKSKKSKIGLEGKFDEHVNEAVSDKISKKNRAKVQVNGDSVIFTTEKKLSDHLYGSISILTTLKLASVSLLNNTDTKNVSYLVKWEKDVDERTRQLISNRIKDCIENDISVKVKINSI